MPKDRSATELTDSELEVSGGAGGLLTENISLNFAKCEFEYVQQKNSYETVTFDNTNLIDGEIRGSR